MFRPKIAASSGDDYFTKLSRDRPSGFSRGHWPQLYGGLARRRSPS
jgi:hypothetical protein